MKQETINKNKLLTILCAVALTLGVLVSAVLFSVTPVHAEEATVKHSYYVNIRRSYSSKSDIDESKYLYDTDLQFVMYCGQKNGDQTTTYNNIYYLYAYIQDDRYPSGVIYAVNDSLFKDHIDFSYGFYKNGDLVSDTWTVYAWLFNNRYNYNGVYETIDTNVPMFETRDQALAFCRTGAQDGLLNPDSINTSDETYSFTGFTMNGKTARWTGTTERSYAKEADVEEYVKVSYAWATTTEPDNLGELQSYDGEFPTSDKQLTLPWSEMENGKTDFQFIRQVKIFPCYRVPHTAYYIGQPVTIYYNADGSINKVLGEQLPFMYPSSDTSIQGNNSIKLIDYNVTKDFKVVWSGLDGIGSQRSTHSFIEFEVGYALSSSPGNVSSKSVVKERCLVSSGSFQIPSSYVQADSNKYVLYVKATPYHYNGDDPTFRLYRGSPSYKYFDENGDPSWDYTDTSDVISGGGGLRRGTVNLTDFFLSGVSVKDSLLGYSTITWTGTTKDSDLLFVPESDTAVIATYILTTKEGDKYKYTPVTYGTTTINAGKMNINVAKLVDEAQKSGEAWDMEIRLTPTYTCNGILYIGEQTVCHMTNKTVKNETTNPDGSLKIDDVTDNVVPGDVDGKVNITADDLAGYTNIFVSFLKGLINAMGQIPQLIGTVFSFLPDMYRNAIGILFIVILILRILGR